MKAWAASARMLSMLMVVSLLAGCASLPFFGKDDDDAARAPAEPQVPLYELEVRAPGKLQQLLLDYLDLARFQSAPASEAITPAELERLAAAAPAQARSLLETMPSIGDVVSASSGRAALELTARGAFDFVLLDLAMDGLNGLEVARELSRRPASPRIIMMSLYDEPEFAAAAVAAGADVLIHKPSLGVQLEPLLDRLFARAA
jgi:CheY-like chemotaxis protein